MTLLAVAGLTAGYGQVQVLHGVDLQVAEGEIAVVLEANGAGKTTALRALSGMIRSAGEVRFDGQDLTATTTQRLAHLGVAHVPQGRGTFGDLIIEENLVVGGYVRGGRAKVDVDRWYDVFPGLAERRRQKAGSLSGGEQQMLAIAIAIARALVSSPRLLLLDEPSLGLAPIVTQGLFRVLEDVNREAGTATLVVEQNAHLALDIGATAFVLEAGRVVTSGPAAQMQQNEDVRRAYLGY